jgi:hypothetical protein
MPVRKLFTSVFTGCDSQGKCITPTGPQRGIRKDTYDTLKRVAHASSIFDGSLFQTAAWIADLPATMPPDAFGGGEGQAAWKRRLGAL